MRKFEVVQGSPTAHQREAIASALEQHEKPIATIVRSNYGKPHLRRELDRSSIQLRSM